MHKCVDCGSTNVYSIEFRTDYTKARKIIPLNDNTNISNDDLPYYLDGYYCHNCKSFCSVIEEDKSKRCIIQN